MKVFSEIVQDMDTVDVTVRHQNVALAVCGNAVRLEVYILLLIELGGVTFEPVFRL